MKKLIALLFLMYAPISSMLYAQEFSLHGKVSHIPDGEVIYLKVDNITIDSAVVDKQAFFMETKFPYFPINVFIQPKDLQKYGDYKSVWVENTPMQIDATDTGFKEATITGSETQDESEYYYAQLKRFDDDDNEPLGFEKQYIKDNPNSMISVSSLSVYAPVLGRDTTQMLYALLSDSMKATEYGKRIQHYLSLIKDPKIGESYADFVMNDTEGNPIRLSDIFKKEPKYVLLEFWGSWCGPCRAENPNLVKTYEHFKKKGFEILGVALESNYDDWMNAVTNDKLPWINVSDMKGNENEAVLIYGVSAFPSNYLIDGNGIIIARDLRGAQLEEKLSELLEND